MECDKKLRKTDLSSLAAAIDQGDGQAFGEFVTSQLGDTISFFDYAENYYHGFLTGLLKDGYQPPVKFGVCFFRKGCIARTQL